MGTESYVQYVGERKEWSKNSRLPTIVVYKEAVHFPIRVVRERSQREPHVQVGW